MFVKQVLASRTIWYLVFFVILSNNGHNSIFIAQQNAKIVKDCLTNSYRYGIYFRKELNMKRSLDISIFFLNNICSTCKVETK